MAKVNFQNKQTAVNKFNLHPNEILKATEVNELKESINYLYDTVTGATAPPDLSGYALDSNVLHNSGNETKNGNLTINGDFETNGGKIGSMVIQPIGNSTGFVLTPVGADYLDIRYQPSGIG